MQTTKERCIETIPVGPLGLIALDSHKELGKKSMTTWFHGDRSGTMNTRTTFLSRVTNGILI